MSYCKWLSGTDISITSMHAAAAEKVERVRLHLSYGFTYEQEGSQLPRLNMLVTSIQLTLP